MSTLPNFHTPNASLWTSRLWTPREQRLDWIKQGVTSPTAWDLPNLIPIGPIQPRDPGTRDNSHVDPILTEHRNRNVQQHYVPTRPYTQRILGDTAEGRLLYTPGEHHPPVIQRVRALLTGTHRTPLQSIHRFAPY